MNGIALSPHDRAELIAHVQAVYPRAAAGYLIGHEDSDVGIVQRTVRADGPRANRGAGAVPRVVLQPVRRVVRRARQSNGE
jgi:hypothetical protein